MVDLKSITRRECVGSNPIFGTAENSTAEIKHSQRIAWQDELKRKLNRWQVNSNLNLPSLESGNPNQKPSSEGMGKSGFDEQLTGKVQ